MLQCTGCLPVFYLMQHWNLIQINLKTIVVTACLYIKPQKKESPAPYSVHITYNLEIEDEIEIDNDWRRFKCVITASHFYSGLINTEKVIVG